MIFGINPSWWSVRMNVLYDNLHFLIHWKSICSRAQAGLGPGPGWGPYGPLWAHIWAHMWAHMGPYGSSWAGLGSSVRFPSDFWTNFARFGSKNWILMKFLNDSVSFLLEKLKNHDILTKSLNIWPKIQKIPEQSKKIFQNPRFLSIPRDPLLSNIEHFGTIQIRVTK